MYAEYGYIESGYFEPHAPYFLENYIEAGYWEQGYMECGAPLYIESGYIVDGYIEGCSQSGINISFAFPYLFLKSEIIKLESFDYIFFPAQTLKTAALSYLYDNQISLDPLRIVRAKINS